MKIIKISLAVLVLATIGFFVWKNVIDPPPLTKVNAPKNQFTDKIEKEIAAIEKLPDTQFGREAYNDVKYLIDNYYKANRLGKNQAENNQWEENLSKNLYAAYSAKFIRQAFVVFRGSEWDVNQLAFIRHEKNLLASSLFLEKPSPVNDNFIKIQQILSKYDEISGFISDCQDYSYSEIELDSSFPTTESVTRIARAEQYINNNLENAYVDNCIRLHQCLSEVNTYMFNAHVNYLQNKINQWRNMYSNFSSQRDYATNLYIPLKNELNMLDNEIYNVSSFDNEYMVLKRMIDNDSKDAFNYFSSNH